MLAQVQLWNISPHPLQTFVQFEQCASYQGSRWILSRRQHAPNKQCALNNDVHLITRFYGSQLLPRVCYLNIHCLKVYQLFLQCFNDTVIIFTRQ